MIRNNFENFQRGVQGYLKLSNGIAGNPVVFAVIRASPVDTLRCAGRIQGGCGRRDTFLLIAEAITHANHSLK